MNGPCSVDWMLVHRRVPPSIVSVCPDSWQVPIYPLLSGERHLLVTSQSAIQTISFLSNLVASLMLTKGDFLDTSAPRSHNKHYFKNRMAKKAKETKFSNRFGKRVDTFLWR